MHARTSGFSLSGAKILKVRCVFDVVGCDMFVVVCVTDPHSDTIIGRCGCAASIFICVMCVPGSFKIAKLHILRTANIPQAALLFSPWVQLGMITSHISTLILEPIVPINNCAVVDSWNLSR